MIDYDNRSVRSVDYRRYGYAKRLALAAGLSAVSMIYAAPTFGRPVNLEDQIIEPTATQTVLPTSTPRPTYTPTATMTPDIQAIKIRTMEGLVSTTEQRNVRLEGTLVAQSTTIAQLNQRNRNLEAIDRATLRVIETAATGVVVLVVGIGLIIAIRVFGAPRTGGGAHH